MQFIQTIQNLREVLEDSRQNDLSVGLVPTMGALHEGHLSLIRKSASQNDLTIVSIFVNPIQFGANEDLKTYPRRIEADISLAQSHGARIVFAPSVLEMYPNNKPMTLIRNAQIESLYCGAYREGHFQGVLTVVAKLFLICNPDRAYFGTKDYQQLFLIEKMVEDLNFNLKIIRVPTLRKDSGLALSSRNEYLSEQDHLNAPAIFQGLEAAKKAYQKGESRVSFLIDIVRQSIELKKGQVQYIEIVDSSTLLPILDEIKGQTAVILVAAFWGKTRLIDNIELF